MTHAVTFAMGFVAAWLSWQHFRGTDRYRAAKKLARRVLELEWALTVLHSPHRGVLSVDGSPVTQPPNVEKKWLLDVWRDVDTAWSKLLEAFAKAEVFWPALRTDRLRIGRHVTMEARATHREINRLERAELDAHRPAFAMRATKANERARQVLDRTRDFARWRMFWPWTGLRRREPVDDG